MQANATRWIKYGYRGVRLDEHDQVARDGKHSLGLIHGYVLEDAVASIIVLILRQAGPPTDNADETSRPWQGPQDPEPWTKGTSHAEYPGIASTSSPRHPRKESLTEAEIAEFKRSFSLFRWVLADSELNEDNPSQSDLIGPSQEFRDFELWEKLSRSSSFGRWVEIWRRSNLENTRKEKFHKELSAPQQSVDYFRYQPLDLHQTSIRLVHILPDLSAESYLQCRIFHSTTDSTFVCLSYVWSYSPPVHTKSNVGADVAILMNGQTYHVRPNLFSFLCMARSNGIEKTQRRRKFDLSTPIWIDALCIDQSNPSERIHQVAQMGNIYSEASAVHAWLGNHSLHATHDEVREAVTEKDQQKALKSRTSILKHRELDIELRPVKKELHDLEQSIVKFVLMNPYWQRAWIVQEVFLARKLTLWLLSEPLDPQELREVASQILDSRTSMQEELIMDGTHYLDFHFSHFKHDEKADLIDLLDQYADKQCADPLDRVYSLLALCTEKSKVDVDYSIELEELAYRVLRRHQGNLCLCVAGIVARTIWRDYSETATSRTDCSLNDGPWIEFELFHDHVEMHLENGSEMISLGLGTICECFHRDVYHMRSQFQDMFSVENSGRTLTVKLALRLLPKVLPHRIVRCPTSKPERRPRKAANVWMVWGAREPSSHLEIRTPVGRKSGKEVSVQERLDELFSMMRDALK
jgi:hypothetical protein